MLWRRIHTTENSPVKSVRILFNYFHTRFSSSKQSPKLHVTPQVINTTLFKTKSDLVALSFFLWCAKKPDYFHDKSAFDHMVGVLHRLTKRFESVKGIVFELERIGHVTKAQTFLLLIRIYWRGGMYELVLEAFDEMCSFGYMPNTFARNVVIDVLFKIGRVDKALKVFEQTQLPNFLTHSIALCHLCRMCDSANVGMVLRSMMRKKYSLNVETFSVAMNCLCKMGKFMEILQVLGMMVTLRITISVSIWSMLIDALCKSGRLSMASYMLEKMSEAGCSPNVVTYTSLIKGYFESQIFSGVSDVLNTMESKGCVPDLVLYNVLIDGFSKNGSHNEALQLFYGLPRQNLIPDSFTVSSILYSLFMCNRFLIVPSLISGFVMQNDLVVWNHLICYFNKARLSTRAVELYNAMLYRGLVPDKYTFVELLRGLCGSGRVHEAVNVYHGIVMSHLDVDAHIHTAIIDELIKMGEIFWAIRLFRKAVVEKYHLDVVSYTIVISGLFRCGRHEEACNLYGQMKEAGISPNKYTYNVMLYGFWKQGDAKMVELMTREMVESRIELHWNTFLWISSFVFRRTRYSHPISDSLRKMSRLGLVAEEGKCSLFFSTQ